jgi:hypothetical protein
MIVPTEDTDHIRPLSQDLDCPKYPVFHQEIVVSHNIDVLADRGMASGVKISSRTKVLGMTKVSEMTKLAPHGCNHLRRLIGGSIVRNDDFDIKSFQVGKMMQMPVKQLCSVKCRNANA